MLKFVLLLWLATLGHGSEGAPTNDQDVVDEDRIINTLTQELYEELRPQLSNQVNKFAYTPNEPQFYADKTSASVRIPYYEASDDIAAVEPAVSMDVQDSKAEEVIKKGGDEGMKERKEQTEKKNSEEIPAANEKASGPQVSAYSVVGSKSKSSPIVNDVYFIVITTVVCSAALCIIVAGGYCYYRLQKRAKAAAEAEYPAYGVTGPSRDLSPSGDRKLAQSAQMYHYQHQKQQMIALEKSNDRHGSASDVDSEEENEEGDYTVYECPGLAPTGEMEVKNPLFQDETPIEQMPPAKDPPQ